MPVLMSTGRQACKCLGQFILNFFNPFFWPQFAINSGKAESPRSKADNEWWMASKHQAIGLSEPRNMVVQDNKHWVKARVGLKPSF